MRKISCLLVLSLFFRSAFASGPIRISTDNTLMVFSVSGEGELMQNYFGPKYPAGADSMYSAAALPAYPSYGMGQEATEVALRITHSDGNLTTRLRFMSIQESTTEKNITVTRIRLSDPFYAVDVFLQFRAFQKEDVIEQSVQVKSREKGEIVIHEAAGSALAFAKASNSFVSYFSGDWANEFNLNQEKLLPGVKIIDSKLGVRVNQHSNPSFLLSLNGPMQEDAGQVVAATVAWPGNWQLKFDLDDRAQLHVYSGHNPYASAFRLAPDSLFRSPAVLFSFSDSGAGAISRRFHRWARNYGVNDGHGHREILLNNWEATYFDFNEPKLKTIIQDAGKMGFELFLLDDGWFANKYPRNNDDAGLGDWEVNRKKLPHGIPWLVKTCQENNLKFGIWIEPEMVNPKSELFEKHPDWVITAANRPPDLQRNQLILDLSNPEVEQYVYGIIEKLLTENPGISYLKWDCNRYVTNAGSSYLGKDHQEELFIDYPRALLRIVEKVRTHFPKVQMMACSGGSARIDYGSLPFFNECWTSDNTDAIDRLRIQWGMQFIFPSVVMASHVSDIPNGITGRKESVKFRFDVAMAGKLGVDLQPVKLTPDEMTFAKKAIETYKEIRPVVQQGDLFRLVSPYAEDGSHYNGEAASQMYVNEDRTKAVVYYYQIRRSLNSGNVILKLKGLDPGKRYRFSELNKSGESHVASFEGKSYTGATLMNDGLSFEMNRDVESVVFALSE